MEALNAKLDNDGSDTSVTTNSYRKRAETGQSPQKLKAQQDASSDSESDHEMDKPSGTHNTNKPSSALAEVNTSLVEDDANEINGGIHDDDISKMMLQAQDNSKDNLLSEPHSQAADSRQRP